MARINLLSPNCLILCISGFFCLCMLCHIPVSINRNNLLKHFPSEYFIIQLTVCVRFHEVLIRYISLSLDYIFTIHICACVMWCKFFFLPQDPGDLLQLRILFFNFQVLSKVISLKKKYKLLP